MGFQKSLRKPERAPVAQYGLFKLHERQYARAPYWDLQKAYLALDTARTAFNALSPKWKSKYERKLKISHNDFNASCTRLQSAALRVIREQDTLLLLDTFQVYMMPIPKQLQDDYEALEDTLTMHSFARSADYETLRSVVKNHHMILAKRSLGITRPYKFRLLIAFLQEHPLYEYRRYAMDFLNQHWSNEAAYLEPFLATLESKSAQNLANYLDHCPHSNLDEVVVYALLFPPNQYLKNQKDSLSVEGRKRLEELEQTALWYSGEMENTVPEQITQQLKAHVTDVAPANRSYRSLVMGLRQLSKLGEWQRCLELVEYAQPYFPQLLHDEWQRYFIHNKHPIWFSKAIQHLSKAAEHPQDSILLTLQATAPEKHSPVVNAEDTQLLFAGTRVSRTGSGEEVLTNDLFQTVKQDADWTKPVFQYAMPGIENDEVPMALTANGDKLLLAINGKLYTTEKVSGRNAWQPPVPVKPANAMRWLGKGTLSRNGEVLIFEAADSSNAFVNEANIDLFVSFYDKKTKLWSTPKNLGLDVNSPWRERSPYLHADNKTLVFSSEAHYGFDGFDAFKTTRLDDTWQNWSEPENLGKEVNSFDNDWAESFTFIASGKKVYISNPDGMAEAPSEIVEKEMPSYGRLPRVVVMNGKVSNRTDSTAIKIQDHYPTQGIVLDSCLTMPTGEYKLLYPNEGEGTVFLYADDPSIYSTIVKLDMTQVPDVHALKQAIVTIPLSEMAAQEIPIPLEFNHFDANGTALSAAMKQELDWVAHYFVNKRFTLLIGGYTEGEGTEAQQETLSLARAEAVKAYLASKGLNGDRIWTQGFADTKPRHKDKENSTKNRRIEIFLKRP